MKLIPQKLLYGKHIIILTSTVLTDPPVWRTDRRMGYSIYCVLSMNATLYMLSCA